MWLELIITCYVHFPLNSCRPARYIWTNSKHAETQNTATFHNLCVTASYINESYIFPRLQSVSHPVQATCIWAGIIRMLCCANTSGIVFWTVSAETGADIFSENVPSDTGSSSNTFLNLFKSKTLCVCTKIHCKYYMCANICCRPMS